MILTLSAKLLLLRTLPSKVTIIRQGKKEKHCTGFVKKYNIFYGAATKILTREKS